MCLASTGISGRGAVALKHGAGPPAGKPHQVRLTAAIREPLVRERVTEQVWMEIRDTDLLAASPQHDHDAHFVRRPLRPSHSHGSAASLWRARTRR
jgi:hypothetical protein